MNSWGISYLGSKNAIAEDIIQALPRGDCLVDLFGGVCDHSLRYGLREVEAFRRE